MERVNYIAYYECRGPFLIAFKLELDALWQRASTRACESVDNRTRKWTRGFTCCLKGKRKKGGLGGKGGEGGEGRGPPQPLHPTSPSPIVETGPPEMANLNTSTRAPRRLA